MVLERSSRRVLGGHCWASAAGRLIGAAQCGENPLQQATHGWLHLGSRLETVLTLQGRRAGLSAQMAFDGPAKRREFVSTRFPSERRKRCSGRP
jgi:hypothetical protein